MNVRAINGSHSAHLPQECRFRILLPGDLLDFSSPAWIFSVNDSTSFSSGSSSAVPQLRRQRPASPTPIWSASHFGNRSPIDLARPRAVFTSPSASSTSAARTRITIRCSAPARCGAGSAAATGGPCAPAGPAFERPPDRLFGCSPLISFTCRAIGHDHLMPEAFASNRLTQGECVPTSMAIRHRPNGRTLPRSPSWCWRRCPPATPSPSFIQHAIPAGLVPQVHSDRHSSVRPWASLYLRTLLRNANLLHGRSPLHFECVSGSISHPVRGRPSHSISYKAQMISAAG